MFDEVRPIAADATPYASAEELGKVDDLIEQDVTIRRWHWDGRALKLRVKAFDLDQQDAINTGALKKNPKTGEWEVHLPTFYALTIQHGVIVPKLTPDQAQGMRKKNPAIIRALSDFIWALAALDADALEKAAHALAPPDPATEGTDASSDDLGQA